MKNINFLFFITLITLYSCTKQEFVKKDFALDIESVANNGSIQAQSEMEPNELLV